MGYYIQTSSSKGKAEEVAKMIGGAIVTPVEAAAAMGFGKGVVAVVDNGPFEAAGFCYNQREFEEFSRVSNRKVVWVVGDRALAEEHSGYAQTATAKQAMPPANA